MEKNRRMVDGKQSFRLTLGELERIWDWRSSSRFWTSCSWLVLRLRSACNDFTWISNYNIHVKDPSQKRCTYVGRVYKFIGYCIWRSSKPITCHTCQENDSTNTTENPHCCALQPTTVDVPMCQVLEVNHRPFFLETKKSRVMIRHADLWEYLSICIYFCPLQVPLSIVPLKWLDFLVLNF